MPRVNIKPTNSLFLYQFKYLCYLLRNEKTPYGSHREPQKKPKVLGPDARLTLQRVYNTRLRIISLKVPYHSKME